jgi:phage repressor protein C with HTH and peptisase S24 domain
MSTGTRLREFGESKFGKRGMSKFAEALEIRPQALNNYLKDLKKPGNVLQDKLRKLGADIEYIMTGVKSLPESNVLPARGYFYKVIISVNAGDPVQIFREENYTGEEVFFPYEKKERVFSVKVSGDSMSGNNGRSIYDGEYAIIDMDAKVLNGDVVVVNLHSGRQMIKQYVAGEEDKVILRSYNPSHPDIVVKESDIITIFRVVGKSNFTRF